MMIDKRLVNAVPQAKRFVFLTVALRTLSLAANTVLIFCAGALLRTRGDRPLLPAMLMAVCLCASIVLNVAVSYTAYRCSSQVKQTLRSRIYQKLLRLGAGYQEQATTAKIVQLAVEGVEQLETWFSAFLPQFYYSMVAATLTFAVLATLSLRMALILLVCVPLIPVSMMIVQGIARRLLGAYWDEYANLADSFLENLQGLTTLQIYQADGYKAEQMAAEAGHFRRVTMKVLSMQLNSIIIMDVVAYGGAALGIMSALASYRAGSLEFSAAFVCILLSADFFIPLRRLGSAFHTAMNGSTASKNIFSLLDTPERERGTTPVPAADPALPVYEAHGVQYAFDRTVLHSLDMTIAAGSCTAFVGPSGSGKSTAAKICAGIYPDYGGSMRLCGVELRDIEPDSLYAHTTYISHRDWIFAGTVRSCLTEGRPAATDDELWQALDAVRLSAFVREQGGLGMTVQEGGENLSGGQRQRLSIARALLRDSAVYIFDEATSNIDVESERAILDLLAALKGTKTVIMISHRPENCAIADRIYRFTDGRVAPEEAAL